MTIVVKCYVIIVYAKLSVSYNGLDLPQVDFNESPESLTYNVCLHA